MPEKNETKIETKTETTFWQDFATLNEMQLMGYAMAIFIAGGAICAFGYYIIGLCLYTS